MTRRVVIPFKAAGTRKTRLATRLGSIERDDLALAMLDRVAAAVRGEAAVMLLCAAPPEGWDGVWLPDRGGGLNAELARARGGDGAFAVIHADLPFVGREDVRALLAAADAGAVALAPDRHGAGTNALAVAAGIPIDFVFGAASFARFVSQRPDAVVLRRPGLASDIDTAADLDAATAAGFGPDEITASTAARVRRHRSTAPVPGPPAQSCDAT